MLTGAGMVEAAVEVVVVVEVLRAAAIQS